MNNLDALPWYRSPVMISQVVSFLSALTAISPKLATALGWTSTDAINTAVTSVFGVIAILAPLYGAWKRKTSVIQPLTLTQTGADLHPNTLANAEKPLPVTGGKAP